MRGFVIAALALAALAPEADAGPFARRRARRAARQAPAAQVQVNNVVGGGGYGVAASQALYAPAAVAVVKAPKVFAAPAAYGYQQQAFVARAPKVYAAPAASFGYAQQSFAYGVQAAPQVYVPQAPAYAPCVPAAPAVPDCYGGAPQQFQFRQRGIYGGY